MTANVAAPGYLRAFAARLEALPIARRLAFGALWSLIAAVAASGFAFLAATLSARLLGLEAFGEYRTLQTTVGMFQAIAGFGTGLTATKFIAELRSRDPVRAGRVLTLLRITSGVGGALASLLIIVFAPWIAERMLSAPHLADLLRAGAAVLFLGTLNVAQAGALTGFEAFRTIALANLVSGVALVLATIGGIRWGGIRGAILGLIVAAAIKWLASGVALKAAKRRAGVMFWATGWLSELPILWTFCVPAWLSGLVLAPVTWFCSTLILDQPRGYAEMGLFNAALSWRTALLFLPAAAGAVILPVLANLDADHDRARYMKVLSYNAIFGGVLMSVLAAATVVLAPTIMSIFGREFAAGGIVLTLLALSAAPITIANVVGHSIASLGKMWAGFWLNLLWAAVLIGTTWLLRERGALGMAAAQLIAYVFHLVTVGTYAWYRVLGYGAGS